MANEKIIAKLHSGELYSCSDEELVSEQLKAMELLYEYNATLPSEQKKRTELLSAMFAETGEDCYIEPQLYANWGGRHVHFGNSVYANFNLTLVDDTDIFVGDNTMFAPNVILTTAGHPVEPRLRERAYQFNLPIHIGRNVWIGAGAVVLPGVTVGDNSVIGAGSVVTKDIPANVVAYGNPCRVVREIGERDREIYHGSRAIPAELFDGIE